MEKVDFKRTLARYRARRGEFERIDVPPTRYLMVDGHGDPNVEPAYVQALETLYPVAYALKLASRKDLGRDYVVPPLEGLWWADDLAAFTTARDKTRWDWTLMLMVPDWVPGTLVDDAVQAVGAKKRAPRLGDLRCASLAEGECLQTLHVGPYDDEAEVLARLHDDVIPGRGLRPVGKHHEVYLGDPRRAAPERLRTILRQPVRPVAEP
ncbi:GyrI-like domain-containing protein [Nocardioides sp. GY 10127]|uniref:GyrI-like domain-containing protein n=1 Tax=Nocardioides sp. GY 10127 TaxID=2569762 RepID=UPI0010A8AA06|nr:GyrI-like domain-containing protein [Nocardioides sp. GY 10127]TIC85534.1 hypothetical protein E8D37_02570 [Nocardioides sp. GY 10127]